MDDAIEEARSNAQINKERWDNRHNHVYGRAPSPEGEPGPSVPGPSVPGPPVPGPSVPGPSAPGPPAPRPSAPPGFSFPPPNSDPYPKGKGKAPVRPQATDGAADTEADAELYDTVVIQSIRNLQAENRVVSRFSEDTEERGGSCRIGCLH